MGKQLSYQGSVYRPQEGESVLACLLREGVLLPHACKAGVCQSCLVKCETGDIPREAQMGLKDTLAAGGFFLACQCVPTSDMVITDPSEAGLDVKAHILEKTFLNHQVMLLRLHVREPFAPRPGQYLTLLNTEGTARSYSVANNPENDGYVELHIKIIENGRMGGWLIEAALGQEVILRGPHGSCFYAPSAEKDYPITLAGTGTGLAPLYGIALDALAQGHAGPIHLFHGGRDEEDLYLNAALLALEDTYENFTYTPCVLQSEQTAPQDLKEALLASLPQDKAHIRLFLCGSPQTVNTLKTKAFLSGLSSKHIFVDAFLPSQ